MRKLGLGEIFREASNLPTVEGQGEFIRQHYNPSLKQMIEYALLPQFVWDLPEGAPPYKISYHLDQESNLYQEMRRLYIFFKGSGDHVKSTRKELIFVQLLENLAPDDALLILAAKDKTLPFGFTYEFIFDQLPGILPAKPHDSPVLESPQLSGVEPDLIPSVDQPKIADPAPTTAARKKYTPPAKKAVAKVVTKVDTKAAPVTVKKVTRAKTATPQQDKGT